MRKTLVSSFFMLLLYQSSAMAQDAIEKAPAKIEWYAFRVASLAVLKNSSSTLTAMISWVPEYKISEKIGIGLSFGYSIFKTSAESNFSVFEYAITGSYALSERWSAELFAGAQSWLVSGQGAGAIIGLNGKYAFTEKQFKFFDHLAIGYSSIYQSQNYHSIRMALGANF